MLSCGILVVHAVDKTRQQRLLMATVEFMLVIPVKKRNFNCIIYRTILSDAQSGYRNIYLAALKSKKLMEDMAARGVKYVDCYGVDNALVRACILRQILAFYSPFFSFLFFSLTSDMRVYRFELQILRSQGTSLTWGHLLPPKWLGRYSPLQSLMLKFELVGRALHRCHSNANAPH